MPSYDASEKSCFRYCRACHRCEDKGQHSWCWNCSGRMDPLGRYEPHPDDFCQCNLGVLRWRTQRGQLVIAKYPGNPYAGTIKGEGASQDERDWDQYMAESRETLDDPHWDPISFGDGGSTWDWTRQQKRGQ